MLFATNKPKMPDGSGPPGDGGTSDFHFLVTTTILLRALLRFAGHSATSPWMRISRRHGPSGRSTVPPNAESAASAAATGCVRIR
ncbi:hypothetical protein BM1_03711 [Bipolaris maydis]|nr:hypothetical protein BM1_03711 [Bipolaris maydis]